MLVLCSLGLPLELPSHLAVQLLCLALMLPRVHTCCPVPVSAPVCAWPRRTPSTDMCCSAVAVGCPFVAANVPGPAYQPLPRSPPHHLPLQLLANPAQRRRIAALHSMAAGSVGMFAPPEQLLGGPQAQCTALLAFLLLFCGGVLPTLAIVRWTWLGLKAVAQGEQLRQRLEGEQSRGATPPSSLGSGTPDGNASPAGSNSPAGSSGRLRALSDASGHSETGSTGHAHRPVVRAAAPGGQPDSPAQPVDCWVCTAAAVQCLLRWTVWVLEQAFPPVRGLALALAAMYLPLLAAGCWLAACLLALVSGCRTV